jgi:hypothetical protein
MRPSMRLVQRTGTSNIYPIRCLLVKMANISGYERMAWLTVLRCLHLGQRVSENHLQQAHS